MSHTVWHRVGLEMLALRVEKKILRRRTDDALDLRKLARVLLDTHVVLQLLQSSRTVSIV